MSTMPTWLAQHIRDTTGIAPGEREARPRRCSGCTEQILVGLSNDLGGLVVRVDPQPLGTLGEALALLDGRWTYALRRRGRNVRLHHRDRWQIGGTPHWAQDVVTDHRCGSTLPTVASVFTPTRHDFGGLDDQPPF